MKVINNNLKIVVISLMLLVIMVLTMLTCYFSFNVKKDVFETVITNQKDDMFAIMLEQTDGTYKSESINIWPVGYFFNKSKSYCIDKSGNVLNGIMDFDSNKKTIKLTTTKAYSCTVYFDRDEVAPEVLAFYIGDESKPSYTNQNSSTVYAKWEDDDVASYCITKNSSSDSCSWNETNAKEINITYDLGNKDGNITIYIYLKDHAGNVSKKAEASIILDTTGPVIKAFYLGGNTNPTYATSKTSSIYAKWSDNDVSSYCVTNTNSSDGCVWNSVSGQELNVSYTLNNTDGVVTRYMYLRDSLGNISTPAQDAITLDTTKPTIKAFYIGGSSNPSTTTNESSIYAKWDDNDVVRYCITTTNNSSTCTWNSISGKELNISYNIIESGNITRYLFLNDKAGHVSKTVMDTVTIPIAYAIYSDTDKSLTFIRSDVVLTEGGTYNNKVITNLYAGFEEATYSSKLVGDILNLESVSTAPWGTRKEITNINFEDEIKPISTAYWFAWLSNVSNINVTKLNTSNVTDMTSMFQGMGINVNDISVVGFDSWDTSKAENMSYMFSNIGFLNVDLSKFNVSNVTKMTGMFKDAASKCVAKTFSLSSISSWTPSKVEDMSSMFANIGYNQRTCDIDLGDLSRWNTSNVTDMSEMFHLSGYFAKSFKVNGIGNWNVSNVTNMSQMFAHVSYNVSDSCYIGDLSRWKTGKVQGMYRMFYYAASGQSSCSIGNISSWDVSNVTTMEQMFYYGEAVAKPALDLSSWNVANVKKYNWFVHTTNKVIVPPVFGATS